MTPESLGDFLTTIVSRRVRHAVMIWGPPGVGKSAVVAASASAQGMGFIDVRLSQLAPTDLRGLPVPDRQGDGTGISRWFPPEFLPTSGEGVLFLDELNMAPPTMQGVAQQLILDRKVGSYVLPEGWFVWAAGNRKEDRASVHEMPSPLSNRFLHLEVEADLDSFRRYAMGRNIDERITAFLTFRPSLLHDLDTKRPAWPSPRSWEMADTLLRAGLPIESAVGAGAAAEFEAFCAVYGLWPSLESILDDDPGTQAMAWPDEPSARYAITLGLAARAETAARALVGFRWIESRATPEWVQLYATDVAWRMRAAGEFGRLAVLSKDDPAFKRFVAEYGAITGHGAPSEATPN